MRPATELAEARAEVPSELEPPAVRPALASGAPALPTLPPPPLAARIQGRAKLRRVLYRIADRIERRRFLRALPFALGPDERLRRYHGRLRIMRTVEGVTGFRAAAANLDLVLARCATADVPYFLVPEPHARRSRIGVAAEHWPRLVDELLAYGQSAPLYIGVAARLGRRTRRWAELSCAPLVARAARDQRQLEVFALVVAGDRSVPLDRPWSCIVERWDRGPDGELRSPTRNARASVIGPAAQEPATTLRAGKRLATVAAFTERDLFEIDFPVDAVYMWVDGGDPAWQQRKAEAMRVCGFPTIFAAAGDERFRDNGELRYSLRSLHQFAPWIRRVYLVTDRQVPAWLNLDHPNVQLVDHREIFGDDGALPSFNSHAIGARLHHISGLSEHYLHFNDDVFLGRDVLPGTFFHSNGMSKFFLSRSTLPLADEGTAPSHEEARRNVVRLLTRDFGRTPARAFFHTPIAQRRSTLFELERRYPAQFAATLSHQFRDAGDYEINSWLHHYFGYLTGRAMPGRLSYDYFDVASDAAWSRMRKLLRMRNRDVFCINDADGTTADQRAQAIGWLESYFPLPSSFEC